MDSDDDEDSLVLVEKLSEANSERSSRCRPLQPLAASPGFESCQRHNISTEHEVRKRFITLEGLYGEHWQRDTEPCLNSTTL